MGIRTLLIVVGLLVLLLVFCVLVSAQTIKLVESTVNKAVTKDVSATGLAVLSDRTSSWDSIGVDGDRIVISDNFDSSGGWFAFITKQMREIIGPGAIWGWWEDGSKEHLTFRVSGSVTYVHIPHFSNVSMGTANGSYTVNWGVISNTTTLWWDYDVHDEFDAWLQLVGANTTHLNNITGWTGGTHNQTEVSGGVIRLIGGGGPGGDILSDNFDDNSIDDTIWASHGGTYQESNQQFEHYNSGGAYSYSNADASGRRIYFSADYNTTIEYDVRATNIAYVSGYPIVGYLMVTGWLSTQLVGVVYGNNENQWILQWYNSSIQSHYTGDLATSNTWYHIKFVFGISPRPSYFWIDDTLKHTFYIDDTYTSGIWAVSTSGSTGGSWQHTDNLVIANGSVPTYNVTGDWISDVTDIGYTTQLTDVMIGASGCPADTNYTLAVWYSTDNSSWNVVYSSNYTSTGNKSWDTNVTARYYKTQVLLKGTESARCEVDYTELNYTRAVENAQYSTDGGSTYTALSDTEIFIGETAWVNWTQYCGSWMENTTWIWGSDGATPSLSFNATWEDELVMDWGRANHVEWANITIILSNNSSGVLNATWPTSTDDYYSATGRIYDSSWNNTSFFYNTTSFGWQLEPGTHTANISRNYNNAPIMISLSNRSETQSTSFLWNHSCSDTDNDGLTYLTDWADGNTSNTATGSKIYTGLGTFYVRCWCEENSSYNPQNVSSDYYIIVSAPPPPPGGAPGGPVFVTPTPTPSVPFNITGAGSLFGIIGVPPNWIGLIGLMVLVIGLVLIIVPFFSKRSRAWVVVGGLLLIISFDSWGLITLTDVWQGIGDTLDGLV